MSEHDEVEFTGTTITDHISLGESTVRALIETLQQFNPEDKVMLFNDEQAADVPIVTVIRTNKGEVELLDWDLLTGQKVTLEKARKNIGGVVLYRYAGRTETGFITSVNDTYVFVRYDNTEGGQATLPEDLEFA